MAQNGVQQKKGGSTAHAAAQANISGTAEQQSTGRWEPGRYTLLVDRFTPHGQSTDSGLTYQRGDTVEFSKESEVQRAGRAGAIASPDSLEARRAQAKDPDAQRQVKIEEMESEIARLRSESQSGNQDPGEA